MLSTKLSCILTLSTCIGIGCAGHPKSADTLGEQVEIELHRNEQNASFIGFDGAAAALVGVAVDFVKAEIEKEAKTHEQQFVGQGFGDTFWIDENGMKPKYKGFTLRRKTDLNPGPTDADPKKPEAFRLKCRFDWSANNGVFLVRPEELVVNSAKAKVGVHNPIGWLLGLKTSKVELEIDFGMDATWIDKDGVGHQQRIGSAKWIVAYDLADEKATVTDFGSNSVAGWFPAIPAIRNEETFKNAQEALKKAKEAVPQDAPAIERAQQDFDKARRYRSGAFKIAIMVTERDQSKSKEYLERVAKFVEEQKPALMGAVKGN